MAYAVRVRMGERSSGRPFFLLLLFLLLSVSYVRCCCRQPEAPAPEPHVLFPLAATRPHRPGSRPISQPNPRAARIWRCAPRITWHSAPFGSRRPCRGDEEKWDPQPFGWTASAPLPCRVGQWGQSDRFALSAAVLRVTPTSGCERSVASHEPAPTLPVNGRPQWAVSRPEAADGSFSSRGHALKMSEPAAMVG